MATKFFSFFSKNCCMRIVCAPVLDEEEINEIHEEEVRQRNKRKSTCIIHNDSTQVIKITSIQTNDKEFNKFLVYHQITGEDKAIESSLLIMTVHQKYEVNFFTNSKFGVELLDNRGTVVRKEILDVPKGGAQEIFLQQIVSAEFSEKIDLLHLSEKTQCFPTINIKELPQEYKYIWNYAQTYNLLIAGSIKSRNWAQIQRKNLDSKLCRLFATMPNQEIVILYVFTTTFERGKKNFGLAKLDGKDMTIEEIGDVASYVRKMYTGTYESMEDLFLDTDDVFLEKLGTDNEKFKSVHQNWKVYQYTTRHWFYNDFKHDEYREIIFSSSSRGTKLSTIYDYEFEEYTAGCGIWPAPSIKDMKFV